MSAPTMYAKGKRAPKNAKALLLSSYHDVSSETYPDVDYSGDYQDWQDTLDGNGEAGDCVPCGGLNTRRLDSAVLDGVPEVYDISVAWTLYKSQNPDFDPNGTASTNGPGSPADAGCDIQTFLEWLVANDVLAKKLVGFVKVDHTNQQELCAGISLGGSLLVGGTVTDTQQSEFPNTAWTYDANGANPGGHCFLLAGHRMVSGKRVYRGICWAAAFDITEDFIENALDEAWLLVWEDMLESKEFIDQMDVATFAADVTAATSQPFPVSVTPDPAPAPQPAPTPVVVPPAPVVPPVVVPPAPTPVSVEAPVIAEPGAGTTVTSGAITISGESDVTTTIEVYDGNTDLGTAQSEDPSGNWSLDVELDNGQHNLWATATDADGNVSTASITVTFVVDVPAPPVPEPTTVDEKLAAFFTDKLLPSVHLRYQEYLELRRLAERWLAEQN